MLKKLLKTIKMLIFIFIMYGLYASLTCECPVTSSSNSFILKNHSNVFKKKKYYFNFNEY